MKKKILMVLFCLLLLTGCGTTKVINEHGDEVYAYGRFIEINGTRENDSTFTRRLVYDKDTKIIYIRIEGAHNLDYCPYYCIDENGKAVVAIYNAEED